MATAVKPGVLRRRRSACRKSCQTWYMKTWTVTESPKVARRVPSGSACRLDGGDGALLHRHHRVEGTLRLTATSRKRVGQHARGDLPGETPTVLAPAALALLPTIADDGIPVAIRLFLIVCCDLEGKGFAMLERRAAVQT